MSKWCEHCRDHFEASHYGDRGHMVGPEYGPTGRSLAIERWAAQARDALERAAGITRRRYGPQFRDDIEIWSPGTRLESLTLAEVAALLARYEEIGGQE